MGARGETVLLNRTAKSGTPLDVAIPAGAITPGDLEDGEISLWITAGNGYTGWTWALPSRPGDLYLTDGREKMPLLNPTNPKWGDLGPMQPGAKRELRFGLGAAKAAPPLRLVCPRGVFVWGGNAHGDFTVEIWKGVRAEVTGWVDNANRCGFVDMKDVPAEKYVFRVGKARREQSAPVFRIRMPVDGRSVTVEAEAHTRKEGVFRKSVVLTPHKTPLAAPVKPGEVLVGQCVYDGDRRFADEIVTNDLCNLLVSWNKLDALTNMPPRVRRAFDRKGLSFMTIYGYDRRRDTDAVAAALGSRYLWNNVGELAGYLYQGPKEAEAVGVPQDGTSLREAKDRFVNVFMQRFVRSRHRDYDFVFSTSGSPLGCYELQGGMDFMCNELYAVGSANLAYATSEARGAARKWGPEFWGGWLAEEWQTFPVPYAAPQKFALLKAGLCQQWLMGTSLIVLESGAQTTQAQQYTAEAGGRREHYGDPTPRAYRETVRDFYRWTRAHPRDPSGPEARAAFVMGNNDGFVGMSHPNFAVWGQHATAATNADWRCAAPEATWELAKSVAFPLVADALAPYPNSWLAATPYGQVDVVQVDGEVRLSDLSRYTALVYAGWNTMTPRILKVLAEWVRRGGELLIALPHCATRDDRRLEGLGPGDLVNGGDLRPLAPYRADGRETGGVREFKVGRGKVRLLTTWRYPGAGGKAAALYRKEVADVLARHRGRVTVSGDDARAVSYAVYSNAVYVLNMDCVSPRRVTVDFGGRRKAEISLAPCEMKIVPIAVKEASSQRRREANSDLSDSLTNARVSSRAGALAPASDKSEFVSPAANGKPQDANYRDACEPLDGNPGRGVAAGWWHRLKPDGNAAESPQGFCSWLWDIGAFASGTGGEDLEITDDALAAVSNTLARARANGATMVVRFGYTSDSRRDSEPGDYGVLLGHVAQLGGVLAAFPDVVAAVEAGMVGPWGEMHTSRYLAPDQKRQLVAAWREALGGIPLLVRNPSYIRAAGGAGPGLFNDGYLGTDIDYGTWPGGADSMTRAEGVAYLQAHDRLPYGGELAYIGHTDADGVSLLDPAKYNIVEEWYRTHLSYLRNLDDESLALVRRLEGLTLTHAYDFKGMPDLSEWYGKDLRAFLRAHLGYRFVIRDVKPRRTALDVTIENTGFGRLLLPCRAEVVAGGRTRPVALDLREVAPGERRTFTLELPRGVTAKTPAELRVFADTPAAQPIRFANNGAAQGYPLSH